MSEKETKKLNLYSALLEVQKQLKAVKKGETADTGKFSYSYADLNSVYAEALPLLHAQNLLLLQPTDVRDGAPVLITRIVQVETGESVEGVYPIVSVDASDPQKVGASTTYARRYGLLSLLGIATEDDDALSASAHSRTPAHKPAVNKKTGEIIGATPEDTADGVCSHCGRNVPGKSVYWSNKKHGRTLCWDDQQLAEAGELTDSTITGQTNLEASDELDSLFKSRVG